jgi:hypothetical protein
MLAQGEVRWRDDTSRGVIHESLLYDDSCSAAIVLLNLTVPSTVPANEPIKIGGVGSALGSMKILTDLVVNK